MSTTFQAPRCETKSAVTERVRGLCRTRDDADREILFQATVWADMHPPDLAGVAYADVNLAPGERISRPDVDFDAGAGLAAALGIRSESGEDLIEEALELRHRLPRVWARLLAGEVAAWRARRIAQMTLHYPDDVVAEIDEKVAGIAHRVGPITLDRFIDAAMMRMHPAEHAARREESLNRRQVRLIERCNRRGMAQMIIDADAKDLHDFDQTVSDIAAALADPDAEMPPSLDERRATAVGILADPERALALLAEAESEADSSPKKKARKRAQLVLHISEDAVRGVGAEGEGGVGRVELNGGIPLIDQIIRDWCGRTDTALTVQPVIDVGDHEAVDQYEIPDRLKIRIDTRDKSCVFPYCVRAANRCDHDHNVPHGKGGATCECNIAPLCRRHHRLKTHKGWVYTVLEPGSYLWNSPHGDRYFRDNLGTSNITPQIRPKHDGCFRPPDPPVT